MFIVVTIERASPAESEQGIRSSPSQARQNKGTFALSESRFQIARKAIAKVLTVINEKRRDKARDEHKKKKYTPLDLRKRGTRAHRKSLTKHERSLKTLRRQKKDNNNRPRKYALAA